LYSVILVDDEMFTRMGLRNLINWESCGFRVIGEADNGEDALEIVRRDRPDLVITDIRMPVMDGLELIRLVREDESLAGTAFIIVSGYDDFAYAQKAVRYGVVDFILKPVDDRELEGVLKKLAERLDRENEERQRQTRMLGEQMVSALIRGDAPDGEAEKWAAAEGYRPDGRFRYVLVEVNDLHPWQDRRMPATDDILRAIREEAAALLGLKRPPYVHIHSKRFGLIVPDDRWPEGSGIGTFLGRLREALERRLDTPVYLFAGQSVGRLRDLRDAYLSASAAALHKYAEDRRVIIHDGLSGEPLNYASLDPALIRRLAERAEEGDGAALAAAIDDVFRQFRNMRFAPEAVKLAVHACVSEMLNTMGRLGIDGSELEHLPPMLGWQDLSLTPEELKRLFTAFMAECADRLAVKRKDSIKGSIQKIKEYIEEHYHENISLKSIAATFYTNPVYLGQLFKKTYGMYFNEYLLSIRIREAKKLLRRTDLRIYEIASRVGFSNPDYFVTQFEKIEKMTPTEYRNRLV
jgi:two-component system response regulator YesN